MILNPAGGGGGVAPYNGLYGEAPGYLFKLNSYEFKFKKFSFKHILHVYNATASRCHYHQWQRKLKLWSCISVLGRICSR